MQLYARRKGANVPCTHVDIRRQVVGVGPFFHRMGPRDQIQVIGLCNKHLYLRSRLTSLTYYFESRFMQVLITWTE